MKKITAFLFFFYFLTVTLSARYSNEGRKFTIRGEIAGISVGDTLRFERVELPDWKLAPGFETVVTTPDFFEYTGRHPHIQCYLMTYLPHTGKVPEASTRGIKLIIDQGSVTLTGQVEDIYFSRVEGEAFGEHPLLREARELQKSMQLERSAYLKESRAAFERGDSISGREYQKQFNEFRRDEETARVRELEKEFLRLHPSSPWNIVSQLERSSYTPVDSLEVFYNRLDAPARSSFYGTLLRKTIDELARLLPGQVAPGFTATLPDGTAIDSDQFRGKYLLIYHWGFCPGSLQLETEATQLYHRFQDHFQILGITDSLDAIREAALKTSPDAEFQGKNLKAIYESMAVHPWIDVETATGENHKIGEMYAFGGYPFFILLSPDGKIVSRGFHPTFKETKKILEDQYQPKN